MIPHNIVVVLLLLALFNCIHAAAIGPSINPDLYHIHFLLLDYNLKATLQLSRLLFTDLAITSSK